MSDKSSNEKNAAKGSDVEKEVNKNTGDENVIKKDLQIDKSPQESAPCSSKDPVAIEADPEIEDSKMVLNTKIKDEDVSDEDWESSVSAVINPPYKVTRSKRKLMEKRQQTRCLSSTSSGADSFETRKAFSEPPLVVLDDSSDSEISCLSGRPNRQARVRGEIIRKMVQEKDHCGGDTCFDSDSSAESRKPRRKRRAKTKVVRRPTSVPIRKQYLVNRLAKKQKFRQKLPNRNNVTFYKSRHFKKKPKPQEVSQSEANVRVVKRGRPRKYPIADVKIQPKANQTVKPTNGNKTAQEESEVPKLKVEPSDDQQTDEKATSSNPKCSIEEQESTTKLESEEKSVKKTVASSKLKKLPRSRIKKSPDGVIRKRGRPRLIESIMINNRLPSWFNTKLQPFLQDTFCFVVAPKLSKCRECRIATSRGTNSKRMMTSYCRFMEYRKLYFNRKGLVASAGFSKPSDATWEDLKLWLPSDNLPEDLSVDTSKALIEHVGDQFCDLVEQEREALSLHVGKEKAMTWKRSVQGVREMCDVCSTTIFNIHWVCPVCGLAVCIDCYKVRKQGITAEVEGDAPKNRDEYKWLLCALRQPHEQDKLVMAQIIPGEALWEMHKILHKVRKDWKIPEYCKCNPHAAKKPSKQVSTGICKQLMSQVKDKFSIQDVRQPSRDNEEDVYNGKTIFDDLDIPVIESDILGRLPNFADIDTSEHNDDAYHSYEDFASLRGMFLQKPEDEEDVSERDIPSFSIEEIIECVTNIEREKRGEDDKTLDKPFLKRYPQPSGGRDPLPIRIYTLAESSLLYSDVPHSWLCNGRLLLLHQPQHRNNLSLFQECWKRGQPILVKGVDERLDMNLWRPDGFCRDFGEIRNDLVNCKTGAVLKNQPMRRFWEGFESFKCRMKDENGEYMLLKLKDWPPGEDFSEKLPKRFHDLMRGLPLPEYTHRDGILNLAGRLPTWFVRPDLGPKMYNAYGSALYPTKGTTNLHLDVSDAVNVMVYVGIPCDGNAEDHIQEALKAIDEGGCDSLMRQRVRSPGARPGALWHIYQARDADKIRDLLTKVAKEQGEKIEAHHDPIHDQNWYIDPELRKRLYQEYGVEGYAIAQCLGDAVFIPAGAPHQVRNLHSCVKVAEDFVSPENIAHCFKLTQEFRHLSDTHSNHEDKLQIKNIIYHVVKDAFSHLTHPVPHDNLTK